MDLGELVAVAAAAYIGGRSGVGDGVHLLPEKDVRSIDGFTGESVNFESQGLHGLSNPQGSTLLGRHEITWKFTN